MCSVWRPTDVQGHGLLPISLLCNSIVPFLWVAGKELGMIDNGRLVGYFRRELTGMERKR